MIEVNFENISIKKLGTSSGLFIGNKNTIKSFLHNKEIFEVVSIVSGDENKFMNNKWYHTKSVDES